jgi:hypothetical protein
MEQRGDHMRILIFTGKRKHRIARQHFLQPKDDHRDEHKRRNRDGETLNQDAPHGVNL